jgi:phage terminase Nu1 subunit (DNA packaging protein)
MNLDSDDNRMVRAKVLTEFLGVSDRTIRGYADDGIIQRGGNGVYPLRDSVRAVANYLRDIATRRAGTGTASTLTAQRERIAREQADKLEMQNAASRREMLPAKAVADEWASILRMVRSRIMASPARIQQKLGHLSVHDLDVIDREIRDALEDLSNNGL